MGQYTRLYLLISVILLGSCAGIKDERYQLPRFPVSSEGQFEILAGPLSIAAVNHIREWGPYIIVMAPDPDVTAFCRIYDKRGNLLGKTFPYGRGPGDILSGAGDFTVNHGVVTLLDRMKNAELSFGIEDYLSSGPEVIRETKVLLPNWEIARIPLGDRTLTMSMLSPVSNKNTEDVLRLKLLDEYDNVIATNDSCPEEDGWKNWSDTYHLCVSPDGSKLAIVPTWSGTMELFDLPSLERRYTGYFAPQEFDSPSGGVGFTDKTAIMFSDICASDGKVYVTWGGDVPLKPNKRLPLEEQVLPLRHIFVFNWNGEPLRDIVTEYRIERICVDRDEEYIYALLEDKGENYLMGRLLL